MKATLHLVLGVVKKDRIGILHAPTCHLQKSKKKESVSTSAALKIKINCKGEGRLSVGADGEID